MIQYFAGCLDKLYLYTILRKKGDRDRGLFGQPAIRPLLTSSRQWTGVIHDKIFSHLQSNFSAIRETCNLWRSYSDLADNWNSINDIINYWANNPMNMSDYTGPGGFSDPDEVFLTCVRVCMLHSICVCWKWTEMQQCVEYWGCLAEGEKLLTGRCPTGPGYYYNNNFHHSFAKLCY